ncbi:MAG: hypothetical protein ABIJ21_06830 [Nanoarchaeota archaeon]
MGRIEIAIIFLAISTIFLAISACTPKEAGLTVDMTARIDTATANGLLYLDSAYSSYMYADEYLQYVYPGESLACPLETPCNITYRLLDAYFDVYFLEEAMPGLQGLENQRKDAHAVLLGVAKNWENEKINNVIRSDAGSGGVALDTYCIVGYITKNPKMAEIARSYLTEDNNWMPSDYFEGDAWRNIADESWCIRLFIEVGYDKELTIQLVDKLIADTDNFINDKNITDTDKLSVVYHTLYILSEFEKYDNRYLEKKRKYSDFINYFSYKNLAGNTLMLANLLDVMVAADYDNPAAIEEIADKVLLAQESSGYWKISSDFPDNQGQVFTTFRALIGLNNYRNR